MKLTKLQNFCGYLSFIPLGLMQACSQAPKVVDTRTYPDPESYLSGKPLEGVVKVFGNPAKMNTIGNTVFVSYTGIGRAGNGFSNICFLEIQADRSAGIITKAALGSNLGIDNLRFGFSPRQDCNRVFLREDFIR